MTEKSAAPKTETKTKTKEKKTETKDNKDGATPDKKAEKKEPNVATHEGQKPVTDEYRANWNRIFGGKS